MAPPSSQQRGLCTGGASMARLGTRPGNKDTVHLAGVCPAQTAWARPMWWLGLLMPLDAKCSPHPEERKGPSCPRPAACPTPLYPHCSDSPRKRNRPQRPHTYIVSRLPVLFLLLLLCDARAAVHRHRPEPPTIESIRLSEPVRCL